MEAKEKMGKARKGRTGKRRRWTGKIGKKRFRVE